MNTREIERRIRNLLNRINTQPLFTYVPKDEEFARDPFQVAPTLKIISNRESYLQAIHDGINLAQCLVSVSTYVIVSVARLPKLEVRRFVEHIVEESQNCESRIRIERTLSLFEEKGAQLLVLFLLSIAEEEHAQQMVRVLVELAPPERAREFQGMESVAIH